jgi:hypothetical protein
LDMLRFASESNIFCSWSRKLYQPLNTFMVPHIKHS